MKFIKNDIQVELSICSQFEKTIQRYLWTKSHNDIFKLNVSLGNVFTVFTEIPLLV